MSISFLRNLVNLDLEPIKYKLVFPEEGNGWSVEKVDTIEGFYKRYLYLCYLYKGKSLVPSRDVDKMWHAHILDTRKYAEDCKLLFGFFLHHFPYFGLRSKADEENLSKAAINTRNIFEKHFKKDFRGNFSYCDDGTGSETYCDNQYCDSASCSPPSEPPDSASSHILSRPKIDRSKYF